MAAVISGAVAQLAVGIATPTHDSFCLYHTGVRLTTGEHVADYGAGHSRVSDAPPAEHLTSCCHGTATFGEKIW
jgi:hypothetical protein